MEEFNPFVEEQAEAEAPTMSEEKAALAAEVERLESHLAKAQAAYEAAE